MGNEIISSETYKEAVQLHSDIVNNYKMANFHLAETCKHLKRMRDDKLYTALEYQSFDDYCENMAGIKSRQAYTYIAAYENLGAAVLQLNANLGITKLDLIAQLPPDERAEGLEDGTFEGMSVKDIKELVKKVKDQGEQLELYAKKEAEEKPESPEDLEVQWQLEQKIEALQAEKSKLSKELEDIKKTPITAEVREFNPEELEAKTKEAVDKALAEERAKAKPDNKEAIEKAVEKRLKAERERIEKEAADKIAAEKDIEIKALRDAQKISDTRAAELEKQLKLSDSNSATAKVYFSALQDDFNKLMETVEQMDPEQQDKFKVAVKKLIETCIATI